MQTLKTIPETGITLMIPVQKDVVVLNVFCPISHYSVWLQCLTWRAVNCICSWLFFYVFFYMYIWIFPEIYCTI